MFKILLLSDFTSGYSRLLLKGIFQYAKEVGGWRFYRVPLNRTDFSNNLKIKDVITIAKRWQADAILGQLSGSVIDCFRSLKIPIIVQNYGERIDGVLNITGDYRATGVMAANYFIRKGYRNFAFYGTNATIWSREREEGFYTCLEKINKQVYTYNEEYNIRYESTLNQDSIISWLKKMPSSTALFACDDLFALRITELCGICGIKVPEEIAVLGVDNDEILCNMSDPPLSSIALDVQNGGYQTAKLLHHMLCEKSIPTSNIVIPPIGIERRNSTEGYAVSDKLVLEAIKLIENENNGLTNVSDLLKKLYVSRRVLEKKFIKEIGMSAYQYILNYRVSCFAEKLLMSDMPVMDIALTLGYEDYINLSKTFKRIYNMTPTQYRHYYKYGKL